MIKYFRNKKTAKRIWLVLAIVIVPPFVLWGLGGAMRSRQQAGVIGKIFNRTISYSEYRDSLDAVRNRARMQFGENLSRIEATLDLPSQAWDRLILLAEAKRRRIKASDQEVIADIQNDPLFRNNQGAFDQRIYQQMLTYFLNTQPRTFEEQTRQKLILTTLYTQLTGGITLSDDRVREEYQKYNEEFTLEYLAALPQDFAAGVSASDEELRAFYDRSPTRFKKPLSYNVEYLALPIDEKNPSASAAKLEGLPVPLRRSTDLAKIAQQLDVAVKETGFFPETGPIPGVGWSPEALVVISRLAIGERSAVMEIERTYYLFKLKEKKEPYIPVFEEVKETARQLYVTDKGREIARERIQKCAASLKAAAKPESQDLAALAKEFGVKNETTKPFKYGGYLEGIGSAELFWTTAKGLKGTAASDVLETPAGFYLIRVKNITPVDPKKFEEEKKEFASRLLEYTRQEAFAQFFSELKKKAQGNLAPRLP